MYKIFVLILLSGCTHFSNVVVPLPPDTIPINTSYRKTLEVTLINCFEKNVYVDLYVGNGSYYKKTIKEKETYSVVESTASGERFEMYGCYGARGERFKISY